MIRGTGRADHRGGAAGPIRFRPGRTGRLVDPAGVGHRARRLAGVRARRRRLAPRTLATTLHERCRWRKWTQATLVSDSDFNEHRRHAPPDRQIFPCLRLVMGCAARPARLHLGASATQSSQSGAWASDLAQAKRKSRRNRNFPAASCGGASRLGRAGTNAATPATADDCTASAFIIASATLDE